MKEKTTKTIGSITKAIEILDFIGEQKEAGVTEISKALGYGTSATYHVLNTLKQSGMIHQDSVTKKFRLGIKLWQLGNKAFNHYDLSKSVTPYLKKLRDLTGETSNLTILDVPNIIYVAQEESKRLIKMFTVVGAKAPLYCTGGGKAMLAFKSDEEQDYIIGKLNFQAFTENTITSGEAFKEVLQQVRQTGIAYDLEEREVGVCCIAAPVFNEQREPIASISISGPCSRFDQEKRREYEKLLKEVSKEVSHHLWITE